VSKHEHRTRWLENGAALCEDNKINQTFAMALLGKAGHVVDIAENGLEAIEAVKTARYDAVLMDVQMPEVDGVEATRRIRALPAPASTVYIIAMTASAMAGARDEYLSAGMNDYITKPVDAKALLRKLANLSARGSEPRPMPAREQTTAAQKPAILDEANLEDLRNALTEQKIHELVALFLAEAATHLEQIETQQRARDATQCARRAHALVGNRQSKVEHSSAARPRFGAQGTPMRVDDGLADGQARPSGRRMNASHSFHPFDDSAKADTSRPLVPHSKPGPLAASSFGKNASAGVLNSLAISYMPFCCAVAACPH